LRGPATREHWEQYPTSHFDELEEASKVLLAEVMALAPRRDASILDMGCNVGRHLNFLFEQGYRNLRGVDFSSAAINDMSRRYSDMHSVSRITVASFEDYLTSTPEPVDLIYTRGATFELVHPSFPLIEHVCQVARHFVVMVIRETAHMYPRFWTYEFARQGFELAHLRRPASSLTPDHRVSLMTFQRIKA
jgi:SAM-dependent methyltransferase